MVSTYPTAQPLLWSRRFGVCKGSWALYKIPCHVCINLHYPYVPRMTFYYSSRCLREWKITDKVQMKVILPTTYEISSPRTTQPICFTKPVMYRKSNEMESTYGMETLWKYWPHSSDEKMFLLNTQSLSYEWDVGANPSPIVFIFFSKEIHQCPLFNFDTT